MKDLPTMTPEQEANWVENQRQLAELFEQRQLMRGAVREALAEIVTPDGEVPYGSHTALGLRFDVSVSFVRKIAEREGYHVQPRPLRHATVHRYNQGCRCEECRQAAYDYRVSTGAYQGKRPHKLLEASG